MHRGHAYFSAYKIGQPVWLKCGMVTGRIRKVIFFGPDIIKYVITGFIGTDSIEWTLYEDEIEGMS